MKKEKKDLTQANTAVKSRDKKKIFMTIGIVVACLAVVYVGFGIFFQSHFCFGTTIDGIKAGGKSVEKMEQLITEEIDSYVLNLVEREERTGKHCRRCYSNCTGVQWRSARIIEWTEWFRMGGYTV